MDSGYLISRTLFLRKELHKLPKSECGMDRRGYGGLKGGMEDLGEEFWGAIWCLSVSAFTQNHLDCQQVLEFFRSVKSEDHFPPKCLLKKAYLA